MSKLSPNWRILILVVFLLVGVFFGFYLLKKSLFSGLEFISWVALLFFSGFVLAVFSKVQELSIGGLLVKLNDAENKADYLLASLEKSKTEIYSLLLDGVLVGGELFRAEGPVEPAVERFWDVWNKISENQLEQQLASKAKPILILVCRLQLLRIGQVVHDVSKFHPGSFDYCGEASLEWLPESWRVDSIAYAGFSEGENYEFKEATIEVLAEQLQTYRKLFHVYEQLRAITACTPSTP